MKIRRLATLVARARKEILSLNEKKELEQWLVASPENQGWYDYMFEDEGLVEHFEHYDEDAPLSVKTREKPDGLFKGIGMQEPVWPIAWRITIVVAIATLLLGVIGLLFFS
ncbi:MAG TPA: hypothetical protein VL547_13950 [Dinghuibacter sp.]|uniref:hypothetical protein n=1 Tax=Dinghuibacter sp. TaxID=2024697 RepID=UPI002CD403B0|nr:hypothetical protein [Dinghuibacter sp.]HTJ13132.1 hypothetical protein [Dinghuibacter sp.]